MKEILRGDAVEVVLADEPFDGRGPRRAAQITNQLADRVAELDGTAFAVAVPERHLARLARRRRHEHPVVRDLLDAPRRCAQRERLADVALEDHLLVELADADRPIGTREEHPVQPAIRNGARVRDGDALCALASGDRPVQPVPRDAWPQLREFIRRVAARQHVEHPLEHAHAEVGVGRRAPDAREQVVDVPGVHASHGDDLLREHVERVSGVARGLDEPFVHRPRHRRGGDEVAAEFREDDPFARRAGLVTGAADALEAAGHRGGRLDLNDEIDCPHVDAELQRRGGDQRLDAAGLQQVLHLAARLARERTMVRPHERLAGELVQRTREAFREPAAVDEDQGGAMRVNQLQQARVDGAPDGRAGRRLRGRPARNVRRLRQPRHVLDRDFDVQPQRLAFRGVDDGHRPVGGALVVVGELVVKLALDLLDGLHVALLRALRRGARLLHRARLGAAEESRDLVQRPLRGGEADALQADLKVRLERLEAFQRKREVGAALARHQRVDFVDDDRVDRDEPLARVRGEQQEERLRRRDQDVGGFASEAGALGRRRVAGADGDLRHVDGDAPLARDVGDSGKRRAQVAFDVDRQGLQRRDVQDAAPLLRRRRRLEHQPVEAPEERGQRLAAAGRRENQRRVTACNGGPSQLLRPGRRLERRREPLPYRRVEKVEHIGARHRTI